MTRRVLLRSGVGAIALGVLLCLAWAVMRPGPGVLAVKLYTKKTIMTVAYKAYANPEAADGKYWLSKTVIENTGSGPITELKLSYQIPEYIGWTTPDEAAEVLPGQTVVAVYYPKLPAKVTQLRTKTPTTLEIKIEYTDAAGPHTKLEKREFELRGVTEIEYTSLPWEEIVSFYDQFDNHELLAAYVQDEDPAVKTYYSKVSEASGGIGVMRSAKDLEQLMRSVYNYMLSTGMTYSGAKGLPEQSGDVWMTTQSVRLPRDQIYGNSGLCIELALLWSSIGQSAGAKPYVVLLRGHAFPMLEARDGSRIPIEATAIGGAGGDNLGDADPFEKAVESATKQLQNLVAQGAPFIVIDMQALQAQGIRPPELPDINRAELVKLLDDQRARHGRGRPAAFRPPPGEENTSRGYAGGESPAAGNSAVWRDQNGLVSIPYPAHWVVNPQVLATVQQILPGYEFAANDPATQIGVEFVNYHGVTSATGAIQQYAMTASRLGMMVSFGPAQQVTLGGRPSTSFAFSAVSGAGTVRGVLHVVRVGGSMVSVSMGAPPFRMAQASPVFSQVLSNVRFTR